MRTTTEGGTTSLVSDSSTHPLYLPYSSRQTPQYGWSAWDGLLVGQNTPLGFNTGSVLVSVLTESMALAVLGGVIGGIVAYLGFNGYQTATMNFQTFSQVAFAFAVTPSLMIQGLSYAMGMGFIGGLLPAIRAARLPISSALREL